MLLTDYIRAQAHWRRLKADEYPEDARNEQSAHALDALADFIDSEVDGVPQDALGTLEGQMELHEAGTGVPSAGEEVSRLVSRYGFGYDPHSPLQHGAFLKDLVPYALLDAYQLASSDGDGDGGRDRLADLGDHYGLEAYEVDAALDGVVLGVAYFTHRPELTLPERLDWIDAGRGEGKEK